MLLWGAVGEVGYRSSQVVSGWARSAPRTSQNGSQVNVSLRPGALRTAQVIFQPDFQVLVQNITGCLIPIQTKLISELQYVLQTVSVAPPRYFCTIDASKQRPTARPCSVCPRFEMHKHHTPIITKPPPPHQLLPTPSPTAAPKSCRLVVPCRRCLLSWAGHAKANPPS